jgi:AcrR family transcriptional regulator
MSAMRKSGSSTKEKILTSAAEIIAATGNSEVNISELAKKAKVSRATIHSTFGPNARTEIYQQILDGLLDSAYRKIQTGLRLAGPEATPIERLVVIFRATMSTFSENRPYGKVVLRQLNVSKSEGHNLIAEIFKQVDQILEDAFKKKLLATTIPKPVSKVRQVLFVVTRGLLRTIYLNEGLASDSNHAGSRDKFTEKEVEIEVLRILKLYCSKSAATKIDNIINLLSNHDRQTRRTSR